MVQFTVAATAPSAVGNPSSTRMGITFFNNSTGGQAIHLSKNGAAGLTITNSEYVLPQGTGLSFLFDLDGPDIRGEWGAISTAAGGVLVVGETAERK